MSEEPQGGQSGWNRGSDGEGEARVAGIEGVMGAMGKERPECERKQKDHAELFAPFSRFTERETGAVVGQ